MSATSTTHKFTSDERDSETTLDHTWFRQYSPLLGRWITPDPFAGYIDNPQSLNRYAYVLNNPLSFKDPYGLDCVYLSNDGDTIESIDTQSYPGECSGSGGYWIDGSVDPNTVNIDYNNDCIGVGDQVSCLAQGGLLDQLKSTACSLIPEGRTVGASGSAGGVVGPTGGGEIVYNYNTGEVSAFGYGGTHAGWDGFVSGNAYMGFVRNLGNSNSNYSGPFSGIDASAGVPGVPVGVGGYVSATSKGNEGPTQINPNGPQVTGVSAGASLLGGPNFGGSVIYYSKPQPLGNFVTGTAPGGPSLLDLAMFAARQLCN